MRQEKVCRPCQMHDHWRLEELLQSLAPHQSCCEYTVPMPNLAEPVTTCDRMNWYRAVLRQLQLANAPHFLMTAQLTHDTPLREIEESLYRGLFAWKGYSRGVTTNSDYGIEDWDAPDMHAKAALSAKLGIPWLLHLQDKTDDPLQGEESAILRAAPLILAHKDMLWSLEHITTCKGIAFVKELKRKGYRIEMTLTLHSALVSCEEVQGNPLNKVQPPLQTPENRDAVLDEILSGEHLKGRDAAAHPEELKGKPFGEAPSGIWTPDEVDIPLTYQLFEEHGGKGWLHRHNRFICGNAHRFYGNRMPMRSLPMLTLVEQEWQVDVPTSPVSIIPFFHGKTLRWRLAG